jgi:hypothetical protein
MTWLKCMTYETCTVKQHLVLQIATEVLVFALMLALHFLVSFDFDDRILYSDIGFL